MHPKTKSTVAGLIVVAAFVFGSALVGDPVPAGAATPGQASPALALDEALGQAVATDRARAGHRRRLHLTMPYVAARVAGSLLAGGTES